MEPFSVHTGTPSAMQRPQFDIHITHTAVEGFFIAFTFIEGMSLQKPTWPALPRLFSMPHIQIPTCSYAAAHDDGMRSPDDEIGWKL